VSILTLTPTQLPKTGASAPVNLTTLIAAGVVGSNTGVTWQNTGHEFLVIAVGSGGSTCSIAIGTTIEGQAVSPLTPTLTASATNVIGPFPTDEEAPGGTITVSFGTPANITLALLQYVGVL
jgi:hypothetical protein